MRAIILLLCVGLAAAATCPEGYFPLTAAQKKRAQSIGYGAVQNWASSSLCSKLPVFIEPKGMSMWVPVIRPICSDKKGEYLFRVNIMNPCMGNRYLSYSMYVDTTPPTTKGTFAKLIRVWPGTTLTREWKQLVPIPCPPGFKKAGKNENYRIVAPFMHDLLTNGPGIAADFKKAKLPWCDIGYTQLTISPLSGCFDDRGAPPPDLMGSAKVTYSCYGSAKTTTIGVVASGEYKMEYSWDVRFFE